MATADEYAAWIVKNADKKGSAEFDTVAKAYQLAKATPEPSMDPSEGGLPLRPFGMDTGLTMPQGVSRFAAGAGKAITDLGRGAAQLVGAGPSGAEVAQEKQRDAPLMKSGAGMAGNITGNVIPALATAAIPGVNTIAGGAAMGAGLAALQPTENWTERGKNVAVGGAFGAAVPAAIKAVQIGHAAVQPLYDSGREAILGRALRRAAGDDADAVAQRLSDAAQPFVGPQKGAAKQVMGELVPGSFPTTGQAGGNAGIAAMERAAFASEPSVTVPVAQRLSEQNAARVAALRDMAGTDGAREFAATNRAATANQLYDQAYSLGVDLSKMTAGRKGEITKLLQRPAIQTALDDARTLAANEGVNLKNPAGSVKGLDYLKRALDDQIGNASGNEQRVLMGLKDRLLTTIDTLSPEYAAARKVFQDMSRPINQMDVAQRIADKSIRPLDDTMTGAALARALTDDTAKAATGFKGATLEGVMDPAQMQGLNAIKEDLARAQFAQNAGRGAGSDTVQKLAYNNLMQQSGVNGLPNLLSRPVQAAEYFGRTLYSSADKEMRRKLAEALLNPEATAKLMQNATPSQKAELARVLIGRTGTPLAIGAPAAYNATQQ